MRKLLGLLCFVPLLALAQQQQDVRTELRKLSWVQGPAEGPIAGKATIKVPPGFVYLNETDTSRFLVLMGNPPDKGNFLVAPKDLNWFSVFSFSATGFVKDDEKINADELLKQLKSADVASNEERKVLGISMLSTEGWQVPPHYDISTKRLEWGLKLRDDNGKYIVNYTTRLLGRTGVMRVVLVSDPESLASDTFAFKGALEGFSYDAGERYAEFKSGDKIAQYGLSALVLGGAAALATKKGFWAALVGIVGAFWKLLLGVGVAALYGFVKFFKKKP